jgi:hypothetical protein
VCEKAASRTIGAQLERNEKYLDANSASNAHLRLLSIADEKLEARTPLLALVDEAFIAPDTVLKEVARSSGARFTSFGENDGFITAGVPPAANAGHHVGDAIIGGLR